MRLGSAFLNEAIECEEEKSQPLQFCFFAN
jgi:hypothetical protein